MIHTLMFRMTDIPKDVQTHCKLEEKATEDGLVYMEVQKVIDSLPKQTCRHRNYWNKDYPNMGTIRVKTHHAFRYTTQN